MISEAKTKQLVVLSSLGDYLHIPILKIAFSGYHVPLV